jgi:hypothetical protein
MCSMSAPGDSTSNRGVSLLPAPVHPHIPGHTWEHRNFQTTFVMASVWRFGDHFVGMPEEELGLASHVQVILCQILELIRPMGRMDPPAMTPSQVLEVPHPARVLEWARDIWVVAKLRCFELFVEVQLWMKVLL